VSAHHSHPVEKIHLSFPHVGYTYALGRDSERDGEYWLEWVAYPGSGPPRDLGMVRHFRSQELSRWLETSGVGSQRSEVRSQRSALNSDL
jgi:hypothetical protein